MLVFDGISQIRHCEHGENQSLHNADEYAKRQPRNRGDYPPLRKLQQYDDKNFARQDIAE